MRNPLMPGWLLFFLFPTAIASAAEPFDADSVKFQPHRIGTVRGEACGVGDFNNDGKLDIVAGPFLYLAPDWKPSKIREIAGQIDEKGDGYTWDFMNAPLDVDGDGWLDVVSCSWHGKLADWYRNPGRDGGLWKVAIIEKNGNYETGDLWDIDGDGVANEILPSTAHTCWYEVAKKADGTRGVVVHQVCDRRMTWGGGVGDVNGDGRPDILRPNAWFEAPADPRGGTWKEHPLAIGSITPGKVGHTPQILVYDVNADGLNDIITSSAHKHGIFWYEQVGSSQPSPGRIVGTVTAAIKGADICEIDVGSDNGVKVGQRFDVRRSNGEASRDIGRVQVVVVRKDKAACKRLPSISIAPPMVKGDKVTLAPPPTAKTMSWQQHTIDDTWTQAHALTLADLDNDGDLDLVTGKRYRAHNGGDPEADKPPGVYWYELAPGPVPTWKKHVISFDRGMGAGMNIPVVDLDADGDLDIIVTGKWGGPAWFENKAIDRK